MKINRLHWLIPIVLVTMILAFWWPPFLTAPANVFDESMLLVAPDLVLHGKVAYRDFGTYYGPANLWVLALAYKLAEPSFFVERLVGIFYRLCYLATLSAVCWQIIPRLVWLVVLVAMLVTVPLSLMAMAWIPSVFLGLSAVLIACQTERESSKNLKRRSQITLGSGVVMGLGLVFRPDTAPAVFLGLLPILLTWTWSIRLRWGVGLGVGTLPLLAQAWIASPKALWNNLFYEPVILSSPARTLPLGSSPLIVQLLVALTIFLCLSNIANALWRKFSKNSPANDLLYLCTCLFGGGLTHQLLQRCDPWHVAMGMMVTVPLSVITMHHWLQPLLRNRKIYLYSASSLGIILTTFLFQLQYKKNPEKWNAFLQQTTALLARTSYPVTFGQRVFPTSHPIMQDRVASLLQFMDGASKPGEKVFVGPGDLRRTQINDIFLYYLLMPRLQPGSYYIELNPLVASAEDSGLAEDLKRCEWVILNRAWDSLQEPNRSREPGSEKPVRVLNTYFKEVFRAEPFVVYRRNTLVRL